MSSSETGNSSETPFKIRASSSSSLLFLLTAQSRAGILNQECLSQETRCWVEFVCSEQYPGSFPSLCSPKPLPAQGSDSGGFGGDLTLFNPPASPTTPPSNPLIIPTAIKESSISGAGPEGFLGWGYAASQGKTLGTEWGIWGSFCPTTALKPKSLDI